MTDVPGLVLREPRASLYWVILGLTFLNVSAQAVPNEGLSTSDYLEASRNGAPDHKKPPRKKRHVTLEADLGDSQTIEFCNEELGGDSDRTSDVIPAPVGGKSPRFILVTETPPNVDLRVELQLPDESIASVSALKAGVETHETFVTIPQGGRESNPFRVSGVSIGQTTLTFSADAKNFPHAWAPAQVLVWGIDSPVDYHALGTGPACYDSFASPELKSTLEEITSCGTTPTSIAADGASRLLLRLKTVLAVNQSAKACFQIIDDGVVFSETTFDSGRLESPCRAGVGPQPCVPTADANSIDLVGPANEFNWALATYVAPNDFGTDGHEAPLSPRTITVGVAFLPQQPDDTYRKFSITTTQIKIPAVVQAPVVLVHGLGSDREIWSSRYEPWSQTQIGHIFGYRETNFHPVSVNARGLKQFVSKVLSHWNERKTAVTRVDIVAHSMGGLVARRMFDDANFRAVENFQMGSVRKLAALGSPFKGSSFANMYINIHENLGHDSDVWSRKRLEQFEETFAGSNPVGSIHNGAMCDLAENNPAVEFQTVPEVRFHAFVGAAGIEDDFTPPFDKLRQLKAYLGLPGFVWK